MALKLDEEVARADLSGRTTFMRGNLPGQGALHFGGRRFLLGILIAWAVPCLQFPRASAQFPPFTILDQEDDATTAYLGSEAGNFTGAGASIAGGLKANGDGLLDFLVAAPGSAGGKPGRVFLVLSRAERPRAVSLAVGEGMVDLSWGGGHPDRFGASVAVAGDVDGDGAGDFLIGIPGLGDAPGGAAALVFGRPEWPSRVVLSTDLPRFGLLFFSDREGDELGTSVAGVGDINGDGFADFALGAPKAAEEGRGRAGRLHLVFGGHGLRALFAAGAAPIDLAALTSEQGLAIDGPADGSRFGSAVSAVGDIDGDGVADFAAGAPGLTSAPAVGGAAYLIFGAKPFGSTPDLASPDGQRAVQIAHPAVGAELGAAISGGLDATGDGKPDVLAGAPGFGRGEVSVAGSAVLLKGGPGLRGEPRIVLGPPFARAIFFLGGRDDGAGAAVALVPDTGGDGIADLLVGGPRARSRRGVAYLVNGGSLPPFVFLDDLGESQGATFFHGIEEASAGAAVAGLGDLDGDGRGEVVVGAPGAPVEDREGGGVAYEVRTAREEEPPRSPPRDLACKLKPARKVFLSWINGGRYGGLEVLRDGRPIAALPPDALFYLDQEVPPGEHAYLIRANREDRLVSNVCRVLPESLPVRELHCVQIPGTTKVKLTWRPGDEYGRLAVLANGKTIEDDLPGETTSFLIDLGPGLFSFLVFDPERGRIESAPHCELRVVVSGAGPITGFICKLVTEEGQRAVELRWNGDPVYTHYELFRDGVPLESLDEDATSFRDREPPPGLRAYEVVGFAERLHPSPPARCSVTVPGAGGPVVRGSVRFADGGPTPIRRGTIQVLDAQERVIGSGQPAGDGNFEIAVRDGRAAALRYEVQVPPLGGDDPLPHKIRVETAVLAGRTDISVPVPVIAVAGLREPASRWGSLVTFLEKTRRGDDGRPRGGFAFAFPGQGDLLRSAVALRSAVLRVRLHVLTYLAAEPEQVEIVAHGFSGLAARVVIETLALHDNRRPVGTLILLGSPQLSTSLAGLDALAALPKRSFFERHEGEDEDSDSFNAAQQQLPDFLAAFNRRFRSLHGAKAHLVAGTGGSDRLDTILGCADHDGRVCTSSALGGLPDAARHLTGDTHESLGRSPGSLDIIGRILDDPSLPGGGVVAGGGMVAAAPAGGGAADPRLASGEVYSSVLAANSGGELQLLSDTSGSIIVILNNELPGDLNFRMRTPAGVTVDPSAADALPDVSYLSFTDGEGHRVQAYTFDAGEQGTYTAIVQNASGTGEVAYSLQIYLDSRVAVDARIEPNEVVAGASTVVTAAVTFNGAPVLGAAAEARLSRPDGVLQIVILRDDGRGADAAAGDGVFAAPVPSTTVPGLYLVTVRSSGTAPVPFLREEKRELTVRSGAARFVGEFTSGIFDREGDGKFEGLWIRGTVDALEKGNYLVLGRLTDLAGNAVADGGVLFNAGTVGTHGYQIFFEGTEINAARREGPFRLAEVELLDGELGFVLCERRTDALVTPAMGWNQFAAGGEIARPFIRGDANADSRIDLTDAITVLSHLFTIGFEVDCADSADVNADRAVDIADPVFLLGWLFINGREIPAPSPECGTAPGLGCTLFNACP